MEPELAEIPFVEDGLAPDELPGPAVVQIKPATVIARINFAVGAAAAFQVAGQPHAVILNAVEGARALFTAFSDPVDFDLGVGEEAVIDVNSDGVNDIHAYLKSLNGEAKLQITKLAKVPVVINDGLRFTDNRHVKVRINPINDLEFIAISESDTFDNIAFESYDVEKLIHNYTFKDPTPGNKAVYVRLRTKKGVTATTLDKIELVATIDEKMIGTDGCPVIADQPYKHAFSRAVYYVTGDCTKKQFNSSESYFSYFDDWSEVHVIKQETLDAVPWDAIRHLPKGPKYNPKDGSIIKIISDPKVSLLLGNDLYWIISESVFGALNYAWDWVEDIDEKIFGSFGTGQDISDTTRHPVGTVVKYADTPDLYLLGLDSEDEYLIVRRKIVNDQVLEDLGFRRDRIIVISDLEVYPDGDPLDSL